MKRIIIVGIGEMGDMLYEYLSFDSNYDVVAFATEHGYGDIKEKKGLPVFFLEDLTEFFSNEECRLMVAISFVEMNQTRKRVYEKVKSLGYKCASYVSTKSSVWRDALIGENVIIMEGATVQYSASIGDNVVMWPNSSIGHHCIVKDHCWISAGSVVGGFATVEESSFLGINSSVKGRTVIGRSSLIGAGVYINKNTEDYSLYGNTSYKNELAGIENTEKRKQFQLATLKSS